MEYRTLIVLLVLMTMTPMQASMARIYKWVDAQGNVQYSEQRPPGVKTEELSIKTAPADTQELDRLKEQAGFTTKEGAKTPEEALAPTGQDKAQMEKDRQENCRVARENLRVLETSRRVASKDEHGNYVRLDDNQRQAQMEAARKQIEQYCK